MPTSSRRNKLEKTGSGTLARTHAGFVLRPCEGMGIRLCDPPPPPSTPRPWGRQLLDAVQAGDGRVFKQAGLLTQVASCAQYTVLRQPLSRLSLRAAFPVHAVVGHLSGPKPDLPKRNRMR